MAQAAPTAYTHEQAEEYDEQRFTSVAGKRKHEAELRQLMWGLKHVTNESRVLEVGCGTGRLLTPARSEGYTIEGADASPDMLRVLQRKLGEEHVALTLAEAAKLPFDDQEFDMVYAIRLLNQTESPEYALSAIREMLRVTRPHGIVLVEFINHYRPKWGSARRPTTRLRPSEVVRTARADGATVIGVRGSFFLGMQAYDASPTFMLGLTDRVDRGLSRLLPRLCSRVYVLLQKGHGA